MSVIDTVKSRPLLFGSVAVGGIILIIALRASSGGTVPTTGVAYGSDVGAGDALQQMQLQVNRDIAIAGIQSQASADNNAAALEAAKLDYEYKNNSANLEYNINMATINATLQALTNRDTLTAQTEMAGINAETQRIAIQTNATVDQQRILASALTAQAESQARVASSAIAAASSSKKCGFLGLFRC